MTQPARLHANRAHRRLPRGRLRWALGALLLAGCSDDGTANHSGLPGSACAQDAAGCPDASGHAGGGAGTGGSSAAGGADGSFAGAAAVPADSGLADSPSGNGSTPDGASADGASPDGSAGVQPKSTRVDLLLVIDNSLSMGDKQKLFAAAVPDLVDRLIDPACVNTTTGEQQPAQSGLCPSGFVREFRPPGDLHIGIISTSLGSFGAEPFWGTDPLADEEATDNGHLIGSRPRAASLATAPGMMPEGFLAWEQGADPNQYQQTVTDLVSLVGERGAGFESSLEAWFHFLVDPQPWLEITTGPCADDASALCASKQGIDDVLLKQRAQFLRPNSIVAIVLLSDENDCSIRPEDRFFWPARVYGSTAMAMPRATQECVNPNDPCCRSCIATTPAGCSVDATCATQPYYASPDPGDQVNLRCYDQRRRFGVDSLYPVQRYVNALTAATLCMDPNHPDLALAGCPADRIVTNPVYAPGATGLVRSPTWVFFEGILGVPWQDLRATQTASGGALLPNTLRYKTSAELERDGVWSLILGDPTASPPIPPTDPLMREQTAPRSGTQPVTGEALAPPSAGYMTNSINGHEWNNNTGTNPAGAAVDLQYACIFPLPAPKDCTTTDVVNNRSGCDCQAGKGGDPAAANPLCQVPDGTYGTLQHFAKGYPGLRHLQVLQGLGPQGIVASICARNVTDATLRDYGYRPAASALIERLAPVLAQ